MRLIDRAALAAALFTLSACPAHAQWQGSVGVGARKAVQTEADTGGRQLVREDGWLPGVSAAAGYHMGDWTWFGAADWHQGDLDYQGRTQAGVGAQSTTATRLLSARLGASYAWASYSVQAAVELDQWRRDIVGIAAAGGLQERYRSARLLVGAGKTWRPSAGAVSLDAALLLSAPERVQIGFSGLFDPVALDTRRGHGVRLGAGFRPSWAPAVELRSRFDWLKVPRSGEVALTANGAFRGTVTQPEHVRKAITLELAYGF